VLEQKARTFGIENQVVFAGFQKDLRSFYMDADVYVQPSFYEGWGMAVVEAAASGLPIIMTDTGCAGEAIKNEESGIVMRNGMAEEIAEALVTIVSQPEVRKKMAEMARQAVIVLSAQQEFIGRIRESYQGSVAPRRSTGATLICAQAVDERDPLFGFFVGWLRGFAKHRRAIVCALRVSDPPPEISGVEIHRLRTPRTGSKIEVLWNIARISWRERQNYQSVFVRGDSIYLVCFGWLWRLLGKKIVFWYTHYRANSAWFWLGVPWANEVVTAVPESNPLKRAIKIGHHIDTNHFVWREKTNGVPRIVVVGRVSPVKRVPWILDQTRSFVENGKCTVEIVGCATDSEGCEEVRMRLSPGVIWKNTEVPYVEISAAYERSDILISATPASMDKGILEAAASGLIILAATRGILWGLPEDLHWLCVDTDEKMQFALKKVLGLSLLERKFIGQRLRQWVEDSHSQEQHIAKLIALL
jgi:glycosyltransferase involved in cell wall biosynthesis